MRNDPYSNHLEDLAREIPHKEAKTSTKFMSNNKSKQALSLLYGTQLKKRRILLGLSQEQLSKKSSVDRVYIVRLEQNKATVDLIKLEAVCSVLGFQIHELFMKAYLEENMSPDLWQHNLDHLRKGIDDLKGILYSDLDQDLSNEISNI